MVIAQRCLLHLSSTGAKSWKWYKSCSNGLPSTVSRGFLPSSSLLLEPLMKQRVLGSSCSKKRFRHTSTQEYDFIQERNRWQALVVSDGNDDDGDESIDMEPTGYVVLFNSLQWNDLIKRLQQMSSSEMNGTAWTDWLESQSRSSSGAVVTLPPNSDLLRALLQKEWDVDFSSKKVILVKVQKEDDNLPGDEKDGSQNLKPRPSGLDQLAKHISKHNGEIFKVLQRPVVESGSSSSELEDHVLSYILESYEFNRYKTRKDDVNKKDKTATTERRSRIIFPGSLHRHETLSKCRSTYLVRDMISTPAVDLTPNALQRVAEEWALEHKINNNNNFVSVESIVGKNLLSYNGSLPGGHGCGMIYAVGAAAERPDHEPRLVRISYRPDNATKRISLVGKGVTYDTGGLNLKPGPSMLHMKKDMGGAAHVLGLLSCLVEMKAPVAIDAWLPTVENVMDGVSFRPGDVLTSVTGLTTEIGNTDAEGRLILGDALALASAEHPDLIIDFATLTGAARVAMGTSVVPFFSNRFSISKALMNSAVVCLSRPVVVFV